MKDSMPSTKDKRVDDETIFQAAKDSKRIAWTPPTRASALSSGPGSAANRKASSSSSSVRTVTSLHGPHMTCLVYRGNLPSRSFISDLDPSRSSSHFGVFQKRREEQLVMR